MKSSSVPLSPRNTFDFIIVYAVIMYMVLSQSISECLGSVIVSVEIEKGEGSGRSLEEKTEGGREVGGA